MSEKRDFGELFKRLSAARATTGREAAPRDVRSGETEKRGDETKKASALSGKLEHPARAPQEGAVLKSPDTRSRFSPSSPTSSS